MSAKQSQTMKPHTGLNADPLGRKIINYPPTQSSMRKGATGYPGQGVHFDQDLGGYGHTSGAALNDDEKLRRINTDKELRQNRERQYGDTFARGTQGALAADFVQMAKDEEVRNYRSGASQLSKGQIHQTSGQSLVGISERDGRNPYNSNRIDDSAAAIDRDPMAKTLIASSYPKEEERKDKERVDYIPNLTEFLRKEYYRRMGVYCNGARDEEKMLFDFWKNHVSEAFRQKREIEKKAKKENAELNQLKAMADLAKVDPAAARRKQLEMQKKAEAKREAAERAQRLQEKSATFGKVTQSTLKRPQSGAARTAQGKDWKPPGLHSKEMQQSTKGGAVAAAVPDLPKTENFAYFAYDNFKDEFELDVIYSINKDLEQFAQEEAARENGYLYQREQKMKQQKHREEDRVIQRMLELFFFSDIVEERVANKLKEDAKAKTKAAEEKKQAGKKEESKTLITTGHRPLKSQENSSLTANFRPQAGTHKATPTKEASELAKKPEHKSIADMMKGAKEDAVKEAILRPGGQLDLTQFDKEVVEKYQFMKKLSQIVRGRNLGKDQDRDTNKKVLSNEPSRHTTNQKELYREIFAENQTSFSSFGIAGAGGEGRITTDREGEKFITEFFSDENFIKRLHLHKQKICSSKTKKEATSDCLYFIQMNKLERQLNFLDHPKGKEVLESKQIKMKTDKSKKIVSDKSRAIEAEEEKKLGSEQKRQELYEFEAEAKKQADTEAVAAEHKAKFRKERLEELAKPKDKWKVGKKLLEMQREFPHDRVLQRMVKEEFKENQVFRYPEEYDIYKQSDENPKKLLTKKEGKQGLRQADYEAGARYLEDFKKADKVARRGEQERKLLDKSTAVAFERAMIKEAEAYLVEAGKRLNQAQGERKTTRKSLAEIYQKFKADPKLKDVIDRKYPVYTHGMVEDEEAKKRGEESEAKQKVFPDNFKRDFFRLIKTMSSKKPGKMTVKEVKKGVRRLPTTFMVVGLPNSHNKKIVMTRTLADTRAKNTMATRTKVFYREDLLDKRKDVFMSFSDMENCRFEPISGSLNPYHQKTERERSEMAEGKIKSYQERLGENFSGSNPEVFKQGILKKATGLYNKGEYELAMAELTKGFNINSLKNHMDPNWYKKKLQDALSKKLAKKPGSQRPGKRDDSSALDAMKEDVTEQKKAPQEDWEKKKLIPILTEAYQLVVKIENKKTEADKKVKELQKARDKLAAKHKQLQEFQSYEDQQHAVSQSANLLFKTIMCPYRENCPKDRRTRWPKSGLTNVTQFGSACLYAHHPMELQFPETLKIQMQSITQTMKKVKAEADQQKPNKPFVPCGPLIDCNSCMKCNMCAYRKNNLLPTPAQQKSMNCKMRKQREKYEAPHVTTYINEMRQIGEELKLTDESGKKKVVDDNYYLKFGHLKKAAVLKFYGRNVDAYKEVIKAGEIVKKQRAINTEKDAAIQKRWQFKLGLDEAYEPPFALDKYHPADPRMEKALKESDLGGVPLATVRMYIEKVSPYNLDAFSKNVYLDRCIEELILECEAGRQDQKNSIEKMKKQVEKLEEIAELADTFGEEGLEDQLDDEGEPIKFKQRKTEMCETIIKPSKIKSELQGDDLKRIFRDRPKGVWKYDRDAQQHHWTARSPRQEKLLAAQEEMSMELGSMTKSTIKLKEPFDCKRLKAHVQSPKKHPPCPKAHNAIELELIPVTEKIQNLKGVIQVSKDQINNNKTLQAWVPANSKKEADISCFQPYIEKLHSKVQEDDAGDDKPKSLFDRENLFRNMDEDDKD